MVDVLARRVALYTLAENFLYRTLNKDWTADMIKWYFEGDMSDQEWEDFSFVLINVAQNWPPVWLQSLLNEVVE